MTFTQLREIYNEVNDLAISGRDVAQAMCDEERDFEVDCYRFIHKDNIDEVQQDELQSDLYTLGCFNAWFLADVLEIDLDVIEAMQESEAFEAIGKLVVSMDKVEELQAGYASADGYGHHFNHYDGNEEEIGEYYAFRTN